MTVHDTKQQLLFSLFHIYDEREATIIADWVMERITGWTKIDRVVNKTAILSTQQEKMFEQFSAELSRHRPVQYVLQEAWFNGMKLYVDENVLIPRPETEELVQWITTDAPALLIHDERKLILDIGTGSGCIAIALKKNIPDAEVWACDVSDAALNVARLNADTQQAQIDFVPLDFLDTTQWHQLPKASIIVSNPPYIPLKDKDSMSPNVLNHEPHLALFVSNDDPLLFYKAIAMFANEHLHENGCVYVEIHESLGKDVVHLFQQNGFNNVTLKKDLQGRDRMVKAERL